jgi:hypothetical protein
MEAVDGMLVAHRIGNRQLEEGIVMAERLGPIKIDCDAPPYAIVRGCHKIGLSNPEDVGWHRFRNFLNGRLGGGGLFPVQAWKAFLGIHSPEHLCCPCGHSLPKLEKYTFTYLSGREAEYFLGQCGHCQTIFWDEP